MDDLVDENLQNHALNIQREVAKKFRNLGIGVMGIQDMFIKLGLTYGKPESIRVLDNIMKTIIQSAIKASHNLALQRGSFPEYSEKIFDSEFYKNTGLGYVDNFKKDGLRNSTLLSVAPTGSIGTLLNISSGVEPWFSMHYTRNTKSLEGKDTSYEVWAPIAEEANKRNWHPETLVTSNDISWKEHIDIQAVVQKYVDTAVSKTINMPRGTTSEEVKQAYIYAWKKGLKGLTVYVDGSRDPILTTSPNKTIQKDTTLNKIQPVSRDEFGDVLTGNTYKKKTACGTLYITINKDEHGNIVEIFTNSSKNGTCKANLNGETRMASLALRAGVKVDEVIDQLKGIHCQSCAFAKAKGNSIDGTSCPDIMARCIKEAYTNKPIKENTGEKCPECGQPVRHESGCIVCSCGYSKCG